MRMILLALALLLPLGTWATEARPPVAGIYGGVGLNESDGSGSIMADYYPCYGSEWWRKCRLHVQAWTDGSGAGNTEAITTTTTTTTTYRYRRSTTTTIGTTNIIDDTRGTSNVAIGAAWCPTYGVFFGCIGVAYLTNDNTRNINQHWQGNFAVGGELKGWRIFLQNYTDNDDIGYPEWFVMGGKQFSVK